MAKKSILLMDGSNFYFKLKDIDIHQLDIDFAKLARYLSRSSSLVDRRYYVGRVRQDGTEKIEKSFSNQQKLLAKLKSSGFKYTLGYLLKNEGAYHEKGVDVQIACDMLVATYEKLCARIILVSSDTDLGPAIKIARSKGIVVEYVGFSHLPSIAMVRFCTESTLLKKEDLQKLLEK
jgi:uncharacterized LabA/DUF88 family protein